MEVSMTTETLTLRQLNRATLARQMLLERAETTTVAAVEQLAGMQAQEPKHPFIGLWTRVAGFQRDDLHTALQEREIVRATMMRATLHLVSASDYTRLRMPLQPMLTNAMRVLGNHAEGLDLEQVLPAARALLAEQPLTFSELRPLLQEAFSKVNDRALGYATRCQIPLIMVPTADRWAFPTQAKFALAEDWLDRPIADDPSPDALVLRYLAAFGPATAADVQTWSGLQGMKAVLDGLRPQLATFRDEHGRELFDLPDAPRPDADVPAPPRFLPEFDNLVLAHADRTRVLADEHRGVVVTKNLRVRSTFLWDGVVRGTWEIKRKRVAATLHLAPFEPLPKGAADALAAEGEALLRFVEEDAGTFDVQLGRVG
jgi:hypothetical protein